MASTMSDIQRLRFRVQLMMRVSDALMFVDHLDLDNMDSRQMLEALESLRNGVLLAEEFAGQFVPMMNEINIRLPDLKRREADDALARANNGGERPENEVVSGPRPPSERRPMEPS